MADVNSSPDETTSTVAKETSSNGANKADEANKAEGGGDPATPAAQEAQPPLDPESKFAKFFELNYDAAAEQAAIYNVDVALLLGVSALESGWSTNNQTREVNNPFGATPDGVTPIPFKSIGDAWKYWGRTFGPRVLNVGSDASRFVDNLLLDNRNVYGPTVGGDRRGSYNSVNPDWRPDVLGTIEGVRRRLPRWRRDTE
jgi:hypothetical protein